MTVVSPAPSSSLERRQAGPTILARPWVRLAERHCADARRRTLAFGALFAFVAFIQPVAYRHAYPAVADRRQFAGSFGGDKAIRLFYGIPHDLLTVGGYTAWRVTQVLATIAGMWAILAAVRALRGEEDSRRAETVLAMPVSRVDALGAALGAVAFQALVLVMCLFLGLAASGLAAGPSAVLAIGVGSVIPVFAAVGAVASQLAGTRRRAVELGAGCLVLAFAVRVVADTVGGLGAVRWLSPLGWVEELRAFAHPVPEVLLAPVAAATALTVFAAGVSRRRDLGTGLLGAPDARAPRRAGLRSPVGFAARSEAPALTAWLVGIGAFALIIGVISKSVSAAGISPQLRRELARVGSGSIVTPAGYLGFVFLIFVLVVGLFACSQVAAWRAEELEGRLETMLAAGLGRRRWLGARLVVGATAAGTLAFVAALLAWTGAWAAGAAVPVGGLLLAGANCFALGSLFLGIGALAHALSPRSGMALVYALLTVAFVWQLFGSLLGAPSWLVDLSPFAHLGLTPARAFRPGPVAVMCAIGTAAALVAVERMTRRDLASGT